MHASLVGLADLRRLPAWKQWQALTAAAPPFLGPEFFVLAAPLSVGSGPIVAHAWDGDSMIGALPLVRDGDRLLALRALLGGALAGCLQSRGLLMDGRLLLGQRLALLLEHRAIHFQLRDLLCRLALAGLSKGPSRATVCSGPVTLVGHG